MVIYGPVIRASQRFDGSSICHCFPRDEQHSGRHWTGLFRDRIHCSSGNSAIELLAKAIQHPSLWIRRQALIRWSSIKSREMFLKQKKQRWSYSWSYFDFLLLITNTSTLHKNNKKISTKLFKSSGIPINIPRTHTFLKQRVLLPG